VVLQMVRGEDRARLRVGDALRVDPVAGLYAELKALLARAASGSAEAGRRAREEARWS